MWSLRKMLTSNNHYSKYQNCIANRSRLQIEVNCNILFRFPSFSSYHSFSFSPSPLAQPWVFRPYPASAVPLPSFRSCFPLPPCPSLRPMGGNKNRPSIPSNLPPLHPTNISSPLSLLPLPCPFQLGNLCFVPLWSLRYSPFYWVS